MDPWARRRQTIILGIAAFAALGIAALVYINYQPAPSCSDGLQNQGELAIDCGGPCAAVCAQEPRPLVVEWARVFPIAGGPYLPSSIQTSPFTFLKVLFPPALVSRSAPLLHWESRASGCASRGGSLSSPLSARTIATSRPRSLRRNSSTARLRPCATRAPLWCSMARRGLRTAQARHS